MNNLIKTILSYFILFIAFYSPACGQGFLKADGQKIVNEKGENILLRGMGLGGWMLQEGYMLGLNGGGQQFAIKQKIADLIGTEPTEMFYALWRKNHTSKIDIDSLRAWGFNSVRLPMHYNLYTLPAELEPEPGKQTWLNEGFAITDSLLAWCKANKMYLILDLHAAPGGQGSDMNISDRDPSKPFLWESKANQEKTIALWRKLAQRYANEPWIAAYDVLNEPNYGFEDIKGDPNGLKEKKNEPLRNFYLEITKAIREVDKKHIIVIEGNGWGNNYNGIMPLWDSNMVLSFHKYWNQNDEASIANILDARTKNNVPVWLGETGENSNVWFTACISLLERNNIGWAWWPLKKLGANNPLQIRTNAGYAKVLDYWNGKGPRPGQPESIQGLFKLASDLKLQENIYHYDVIDAMIRQPHTNETKPFKRHSTGQVIAAVDYDLGRNSKAYFDLDSANYRVSGGQTGGNKGRIYRNDGVDIKPDSLNEGGFIVYHIEKGEWLQYTITAPEPKTYTLVLSVNSAKAGNILTISANGKNYGPIKLSESQKNQWQTVKIKVKLAKGSNKLRTSFAVDELQFRSLQLLP
jgi:endoglucanase